MMIDIHNHVIYEFDDGPKSLNESLEMLNIAVDQGITKVFATSHFSEMISEEVEADYFAKLDTLRQEVKQKDINIELYSGGELFYHHYLDKTIQTSKVTTLAGLGKYILMEFPMYFMPNGISETLFKLTMDDYMPIIAHPERYVNVIENHEKSTAFVTHGALLQVNTGSVLGEFGKHVQKAAMWILENRLAHFIGSDAHTTQGRTFKLAKAAQFLEAYLDKDYIQDLVKKNPEKIVNNEVLEKVEIGELEVSSNGGFFQRVMKRFKLI